MFFKYDQSSETVNFNRITNLFTSRLINSALKQVLLMVPTLKTVFFFGYGSVTKSTIIKWRQDVPAKPVLKRYLDLMVSCYL